MVMMSLAPEMGITDAGERYDDLLADEAFIWTVETPGAGRLSHGQTTVRTRSVAHASSGGSAWPASCGWAVAGTPERTERMTSYEKKNTCALCSAEHGYDYMGSAFVAGSPDLDTRPPETERSALFTRVQRCFTCGYCASDVSESPTGAAAVVRSAEYRRQLHDKAYSDLANSFRCKAMLDRAATGYAAATWALIQAAWACDGR